MNNRQQEHLRSAAAARAADRPGGEPGLISIIMPVYNAEKTLTDAVGSVLNQTYPRWELILVDDGSKDESRRLCQEYAEGDGRIRLLCQENAGPAIARNAALDAVRGEFVMFADSDDRLEADACEKLLSAIGDKELAIAHYYFDLGVTHTVHGLLSGDRALSETEFLMELIHRPGSFYFSALWNKMYRADIIREFKLRFDPYLTWGEDFAFNMQYFHAVRRGVALVSAPVYHYIKNPGSTSIRTLIHVVHSCKIKYRLYQHFKALYVEKGLYESHRRLIHRYIWNVTLAD